MTNPLLLDQINAFPKFGENLLETLWAIFQTYCTKQNYEGRLCYFILKRQQH